MKFFHIVVGLMLILLIAGCRQVEQDQTGNGTETTGEPSQKYVPGSDTEVAAEFRSLIENRQNLEWEIVYDIHTRSNDRIFNSTMTQYYQGDKKVRSDIEAQGQLLSTFLIGDTFTRCTKINESWNCYKLTVANNTGNTDEEMIRNLQDYTIQRLDSKQIARQTAKCYNVTHKNLSASVIYCFTNEGVPLYMKAENAKGLTEITARQFTSDVNESAFTVPVKDVPDVTKYDQAQQYAAQTVNRSGK